jgi:hypothetical protein
MGLGDPDLKTVWAMGHRIRWGMVESEASYQLGGLMEMDNAKFGVPNPGKRGRGAAAKSKVVVAV